VLQPREVYNNRSWWEEQAGSNRRALRRPALHAVRRLARFFVGAVIRNCLEVPLEVRFDQRSWTWPREDGRFLPLGHLR
jgi:hypothetical protein